MDEVGQKLMAEKAYREANWSELDRDGRLEALRVQTVQLFHMVTAALDTLQALLQHQHAASGALMAPMDGRNGVYAGAGSARHTPTCLTLGPEQQPQGMNRAIGGIHGR